MMINPILRQTLLISLLGHLTVFNIFSLSFGDRINRGNYASVSFLGDLLVKTSQFSAYPLQARYILKDKPNVTVLNKANQEISRIDYYSKPVTNPIFNTEKASPEVKVELTKFNPSRKEPTVMFYPSLPYNFLLYFKDRHVVHIELMFNIISKPDKANYIVVKRKVSSGNLEADLLSMRYINRYLFIQQFNYPSNKWQSVKIELGPQKK